MKAARFFSGGRDGVLLGLLLALLPGISLLQAQDTVRYARFKADDTISYGIVDGGVVRAIDGTPFGDWEETGTTHPIDEVTWLAPTQPSKVLAVALNYKRHLGESDEADIPETLQLFFKSPTSVIAHGEDIVLPKGAENVHYESELVVVIQKEAKNVSVREADDYILGVTCGNDVSARDWQETDLQWWRAKGADTFGPCGPVVVSGLNYNDLSIEMRLNGDTKDKARTSLMVRNVEEIVSFASRYVTLKPGDLIFTGAIGPTSAMSAGDIAEVEIEGIGLLRNPVVRE